MINWPSLSGSTALITGASSGIGEEFARQLHAQGVHVILSARRKDRLENLAKNFNAALPGSAQIVEADLSTPTGQKILIKLIQESTIDILVNNAGRGSFDYFEKNELADELQMVRLNIDGTLALAHAVIPQMKARGSGAIVAVSSVAAFQPLPFMSTYAATKAFNFIHTQGLRAELRPFGIRVLSIHPGPTDTEFAGAARIEGTATGVRRDSVQTVVSQSITALKRDNAFIVPGFRSWLVSLASRFIPVSISTALAYRALLPALQRARSDE